MATLAIIVSALLVGDRATEQPGAGWRVGADKDASAIVLEKAADGSVTDVCVRDRVHQPRLVVGCKAGRLRIFVAAGQMPMTDEDRRAHVSLVFDASPSIDRTATAERGHPTLYVEEPLTLLPELTSRGRMSLSFASLCSKPQQISFSLIGLSSVLNELSAEGCQIP